MALPADFLEELRARTPLPMLIGQRVKLVRSGRQWKGCCPFHGEKTPSFHVYDDHFHCFGCGVHGDAISFVMQSQGGGFMEAVEQLAAAAGLDVPKPSPAGADAQRQLLGLADILARAAAAFQRRLFLPEGARALAYLRERGLNEETIRRFGLGFAPGRGALIADLAREGIVPDRLGEAGLLASTSEDGAPRELFFDRVIFPIRDRRGRTISFGGRTLGDRQPKYVNGPETALFSKRRSLYALDFARDGVSNGPLVVVEGYMDVIALHQAGFGGAVAPLGTALTAEQLDAAWQLSETPTVCFDGDAAGRRAARRVAELVLPLLAPSRTLRFVWLPENEDPDSLLRGGGAQTLKMLLDAANPFPAALYGLVREQFDQESPEQRAACLRRLEEVSAQITDRALRREYLGTWRDWFFQEARTRRLASRPNAAKPGFKPRSPAAIPEISFQATEYHRILTAILLHQPALLAELAEFYESLALPDWLARVREQILHWSERAQVLDCDQLMNHLTEAGLAADARRVVARLPLPLPACALRGAMPAEAAAGWWHYFGLLHRDRLDQELAAATRECGEQTNERTQRRLTALREAQERLLRGEPDGAHL